MPESIQETDLWRATARAAGKNQLVELTQHIYADAMERAIGAVRRKSTSFTKRYGLQPVSIGHVEAEIAIRQELTESAGGHINVISPTDELEDKTERKPE